MGVTEDLNDLQTVMAASNREHENIKTNVLESQIPNIVDKKNHDFNEHIINLKWIVFICTIINSKFMISVNI